MSIGLPGSRRSVLGNAMYRGRHTAATLDRWALGIARLWPVGYQIMSDVRGEKSEESRTVQAYKILGVK
jgi:hypothetical protein